MRKGRKTAWVILTVWTVLTVAALSVPLGRESTLLRHGVDKVVHTGMFTVMGVLAQSAAPWYSLLLALPVAAGTELLQKKLPYRTYDRVELLANVVGVLVGVVCREAAVRLRPRGR